MSRCGLPLDRYAIPTKHRIEKTLGGFQQAIGRVVHMEIYGQYPMEGAALPTNGSPSASHIDDFTLKVSRLLHKSPGTVFPLNSLSHPWLGWVKLTVAIGVAYFLAARLGLFQRWEHPFSGRRRASL